MHSVSISRREAVRFVRAHTANRYRGADLEHEINAHLAPVGDVYCKAIVAMLRWYEYAVESAACPLRSKPEWAAQLGIGEAYFRDIWRRARRWQIDGAYVFSEGLYALRCGDAFEGDTGARQRIAAPGVGLRSADMPKLPDRWSIAVLESMAATTRVFNATSHVAATNIAQSATTTPEQKQAARTKHADTMNAVGQLPLRIVRTGTGAP